MRPFITPQKTITAADEERYQREIQDRLAPVVSEQTWKTLSDMTRHFDTVQNGKTYAIQHIQQPYRERLKVETDQDSVGAFAIIGVQQKLNSKVSDNEVSLRTMDTVMRPGLAKALDRSFTSTSKTLTSAAMILFCWLDDEKIVEAVCDTLDRLNTEYGILFHERLNQNPARSGQQLWLRILTMEAFNTAIQQTDIRSDLPWDWQSPIIAQQFLKNLNTVPAAELAVLVEDLVRNPPKR